MSNKTDPVLFETVRQIRVVTLIGHRDVYEQQDIDFWDVTEIAYEDGWALVIQHVYVGADLAKALGGKVGDLLAFAKKQIKKADKQSEWDELEIGICHVDRLWRGHDIRLIFDLDEAGFQIDFRSNPSKNAGKRGAQKEGQ